MRDELEVGAAIAAIVAVLLQMVSMWQNRKRKPPGKHRR